MFLATSLGCIHEVVQFCHIIMSIIHRVSSAKPCKCRHEVSEQDISEEIFHLVAVFGKKGSIPYDFIHRLKISKHLVQLKKQERKGKSCKEAFIGWVKMKSGCFISNSSDKYNFSSDSCFY